MPEKQVYQSKVYEAKSAFLAEQNINAKIGGRRGENKKQKKPPYSCEASGGNVSFSVINTTTY